MARHVRQRTRTQAAVETGASLLWLAALAGGFVWVLGTLVQGAVGPAVVTALCVLASCSRAQRPRHLRVIAPAPAGARSLRPVAVR